MASSNNSLPTANVYVNKLKWISKQTKGSKGYDVYSNETVCIRARTTGIVETGLKLEMPEHMFAMVAGRSGLACRQSLLAHNGVIDSDYRGFVKIILHNLSNDDHLVEAGDRIAQLLFFNTGIDPFFVEKEELSKSERGEQGFGHTGK